MRSAESGDAIDHQQRVGFACESGNALYAMTGSGRGFGRLREHGLHVWFQLRAHLFDREGLSIRRAQSFCLTAECIRQTCPAFAKFTGTEH